MSIQLVNAGSELATLCLTVLQSVERYGRLHDIDTNIIRDELKSLQHEATFVESVHGLYPRRTLKTSDSLASASLVLMNALVKAKTALEALQSSISPQFSAPPVEFPALSKQLRSIRKGISMSNKALADSLRSDDRPLGSPPISSESAMTDLFLHFAESPFALQGEMFSPANAPQGLPRYYSQAMNVAASWWLDQQLSNDQSLSGLLRAKAKLFEQMWIKTTQILQDSTFGWLPKQAADAGRFDVLQDQLEQGLRDALIRQMAPHRMVFISTESSGKSTFINALIGEELLPTGRGIITALPCRIIHSPGIEAELRINARWWNEKLRHLREIKDKEDTPRYASADDLKMSMIQFEAPGFSIPEITLGKEETRETLRLLNHIVRLCDIFVIPFTLFAVDTWATIKANFPTMEGNMSSHYEFIDLPGIPEEGGEELAVEVMRNATVIVAIVSVSQTPYSAWRQLPRIIAAGTNLRATVVVATMLDLIGKTALDIQEWEESKKEIMHIFWPESSEGSSSSEMLLDCSVEIGQSLEALRRYLDPLTTKPPLSEIQKGPTQRALTYMYSTDSLATAYGYEGFTLQHLKQEVNKSIDALKLTYTISTLNDYLTGAARSQYHDEEIKGISVRIGRILTMIKTQAVNHGLAPRDLTRLEARHRALKTRGAAVIAQWSAQSPLDSKALDVSIHTGAQTAAEQALKRDSDASIKLEQIPPYLEFDTVEEVESFISTTRESLYASLVSLHKSVIQDVTAQAKKSLSAASGIEEFDPEATGKLTALLVRSPPMNDLEHLLRQIPDTENLITRPSQSTSNFRATQQRILQHLARRDDRRIEDLSILARILLATISVVPFIMRITSHTRQPNTGSTLYRIDLQGLRHVYQDVIAQPWADHLSQGLQQWMQQNDKAASEILNQAVQAGIDASERRLVDMSRMKPTSDGSITGGITDNYCNLAAAESALQAIIIKRNQPIQI